MFKNLQQREHIDIGVFTIFACVVVGILSLFLYCFFGKLATESYAKMADCLYESNWQILNVKCQKYFVLMIENAQEPLYYQGFGIAVMNLETFTKVSAIKKINSKQINSKWTICNFFSVYEPCMVLLHDFQNNYIKMSELDEFKKYSVSRKFLEN